MEYKSLISIIVPVYNTEKYLANCIDSLLKQTYKNLQIILVDDGSTDNSPRMCDNFAEKDSRVEVIHQTNQGVSMARNHGLKVARGEYIGFVDSDDWVSEEMYEYLIGILTDNHADMAVAGIVKSKNEECNFRKYDGDVELYNQEEYSKIFFKVGSQRIEYYAWNKLYKSEVVKNVLWNKNFAIGEDVLASFQYILNSNKIVLSNKEVYCYRQDSGITAGFNDKLLKLTDVWREIENIAEKAKVSKYDNYIKINQARINFTVLTEIAIGGMFKDTKYKSKIKEYRDNLKKLLPLLLRADIAKSRKLLMIWYCINYESAAYILYKLKPKRQ